jgi:hypothetical protein
MICKLIANTFRHFIKSYHEAFGLYGYGLARLRKTRLGLLKTGGTTA